MDMTYPTAATKISNIIEINRLRVWISCILIGLGTQYTIVKDFVGNRGMNRDRIFRLGSAHGSQSTIARNSFDKPSPIIGAE
jgi:hypothetical protein